MRTAMTVSLGACALTVVVPREAIGQGSSALREPRPAQAYDIVRVRRAASAPWLTGTVTAIAGDTLIVMVHAGGGTLPAVRIALDTVSAIERRVIVPGSRAMAAAEGLYWGSIAGGIVGWLGGATYGAVAGGTTWSEGGKRGVVIGASALGVAGAITLGTRHMRGDNGPESIRVEWVPIPLALGVDRTRWYARPLDPGRLRRQDSLPVLPPATLDRPAALPLLPNQWPTSRASPHDSSRPRASA